MDFLKIDKMPVLAASGGGVIGYHLALLHPDRISSLNMFCATSGSYEHPLMKMFETNEGRGAYDSHLVAYYGSKNAAGMFETIIAGDLMTANNQKKGART